MQFGEGFFDRDEARDEAGRTGDAHSTGSFIFLSDFSWRGRSLATGVPRESRPR